MRRLPLLLAAALLLGGAGAAGLPEDSGRLDGARLLREDPFNCLGPYSDAAPGDCAELRFMAEPGEGALRAFKTPSLRGVTSRPPYMHAGQIGTLEEVLDHYAAAPAAPTGHTELRPKDLSEEERARLLAFLAALDPLAPEAEQIAEAQAQTDAPQGRPSE